MKTKLLRNRSQDLYVFVQVYCWQTKTQREESGESQFLGSLWRATLSREAWMPIWGLSTESDFASPPPGGKAVKPKRCILTAQDKRVAKGSARKAPASQTRYH